jgi:hypothetical protein
MSFRTLPSAANSSPPWPESRSPRLRRAIPRVTVAKWRRLRTIDRLSRSDVKRNLPLADSPCGDVVGGRREQHEWEGAARCRAPPRHSSSRRGADPAPARFPVSTSRHRGRTRPQPDRRPGTSDSQAAAERGSAGDFAAPPSTSGSAGDAGQRDARGAAEDHPTPEAAPTSFVAASSFDAATSLLPSSGDLTSAGRSDDFGGQHPAGPRLRRQEPRPYRSSWAAVGRGRAGPAQRRARCARIQAWPVVFASSVPPRGPSPSRPGTYGVACPPVSSACS